MPCRETSSQNNGGALWEAESGGAFDGGPSGQPATGMQNGAN